MVTGASGGLGRGIALRFVEAGANVVVHYSKDEQQAVGADLTIQSEVNGLFDECAAAFGGVSMASRRRSSAVVSSSGLSSQPLDREATVDLPRRRGDAHDKLDRARDKQKQVRRMLEAIAKQVRVDKTITRR